MTARRVSCTSGEHFMYLCTIWHYPLDVPPAVSRSCWHPTSTARTGLTLCRYQLSDEKTFESLFHPQKDGLLRLVDHFLHKTGCAPCFVQGLCKGHWLMNQ